MTLVRTCCCEGCFANDDCPVPYTGLGDFTYEVDIDTGRIAGNFVNLLVTDIQINAVVDPVPCYVQALDASKCCNELPDCSDVIPPAVPVGKEFYRMATPSVNFEATNYPCYTVVTTAKQLPVVIVRRRCTADRRVYTNTCVDVGDVCPQPCQQGGISYTDLQEIASPYASHPDGVCYDASADVENTVQFGALTVGSGTVQIKRNSQSGFTSSLVTGAYVTGITYKHRTNLCYAPQVDCGPCTGVGSGGVPCAEGRCCCRSYLDFNFAIRRVYTVNTFAWNSVANDFVLTPIQTRLWQQFVRCVYEGPVDERLYTVTGTSALRTFTLVSASISNDPLNSGPGSGTVGSLTLNYCPYDLFQQNGQVVGGTAPVITGTTVDDECTPCSPGGGANPTWLSMEQAERLGVTRNLIVTRITP